MKKIIYRALGISCTLLLIGALFFTFISAAQLQGASNMKGVQKIAQVQWEENDESFPLELPGKLPELAPGTALTIRADFAVEAGDYLLVKSVFAPLKVYVNEELLYEYGQPGSYPFYMNDPPTDLFLIPLPLEGGPMSLYLEYETPSQRSQLSLPPFYTGKVEALLLKKLRQDGFSFLFALLLIFMGLVMALISLNLVGKIPSGHSFLWLGLFSLSAGIWSLGECDFSALIIGYPSLLYAMSYLGMFLVTIPFLRFGLLVLKPQNPLALQIMLGVHYITIGLALFLQLTGQMDFTKSLYLFHIITPLGFVTFAVCLLWEYFSYKNPAAARFGPGIIIMALAAILELGNYWLHFISVLTLFFQLGVLGFVISLGIVSGYYMRDSLRLAADKSRLEYELAGIERQLSLERLQYQRLAENEKLLKRQDHDLRHHLAVLSSLSSEEEKLRDYISCLIARIPAAEENRWCENYAVNAIAAYYYNMAIENDIAIELKLIAPLNLESSLESDLCVVVGNLMENAIEACQRMVEGRQFIHISSELNYDILTITVDNSFMGSPKKEKGRFLSSKGEREGLGISSIKAAAEKHGGNARFEEQEDIFQASVYLQLHY